MAARDIGAIDLGKQGLKHNATQGSDVFPQDAPNGRLAGRKFVSAYRRISHISQLAAITEATKRTQQ
jgi:hypothetical protein